MFTPTSLIFRFLVFLLLHFFFSSIFPSFWCNIKLVQVHLVTLTLGFHLWLLLRVQETYRQHVHGFLFHMFFYCNFNIKFSSDDVNLLTSKTCATLLSIFFPSRTCLPICFLHKSLGTKITKSRKMDQLYSHSNVQVNYRNKRIHRKLGVERQITKDLAKVLKMCDLVLICKD